MSGTHPGTPEDHSRTIAQEARTALAPLGLSRRGRSRTWLDDQGWWLGVVEFQPSGFGRGTYLNVGLMFLWRPIDHLAFEIGDRVESFTAASEPDFALAVRSKAERAAQEVTSLRRRFQTLTDVVDHYSGTRKLGLYDRVHLGIALGLGGPPDDCRLQLDHALRECEEVPPGWPIRQWLPQARAAAEDPASFRRWAEDAIRFTRTALRLPDHPSPLAGT